MPLTQNFCILFFFSNVLTCIIMVNLTFVKLLLSNCQINGKCCFFAAEIHFLEQKCVWALEPSLRAFLRHWLYTSRRTIDSLIFLLDLFEFILHIVVTYWLFTLNFHPSLTENTHYTCRHWREPKGSGLPKWM